MLDSCTRAVLHQLAKRSRTTALLQQIASCAISVDVYRIRRSWQQRRSLGRWEFEEAPGSWRPYSAGDCQRLDEAERKSRVLQRHHTWLSYAPSDRSAAALGATGEFAADPLPAQGDRNGFWRSSGYAAWFRADIWPGVTMAAVAICSSGRTDLHDAVLEGFEAVQKLLNRNGGGATEGDDSTVRKMLLQRDIMGANAFHFAMQHGLVAEASAICATAVGACSGRSLK